MRTRGRPSHSCCDGCRKKFAGEHGLPLDKADAETKPRPWGFLRNKTFIVTAVLLVLVGLSYLVPVLEPFRRSFFDYLRMVWWAILLGLLLGGLIDRFIPREYVAHLLARPRKSTVFYAVALGFLMSASSDEILAPGNQLPEGGHDGGGPGVSGAQSLGESSADADDGPAFRGKAIFIIGAGLGSGDHRARRPGARAAGTR